MTLETLERLVVIAAALVGGLWAWRRYLIERTDQPALGIGLAYRTIAYDAAYCVAFDIRLANRGRVKIQAKAEKHRGLAYDDDIEKLAHSASLQLKRIHGWTAAMGRTLNWFEPAGLADVPGLGEVHLLADYEDPTRGGIVDFWMEPNETYHLGVTLMLDPGLYLVKITFVAAGGDDNFWTRVTAIEVPVASTATATALPQPGQAVSSDRQA